MKLKYKTKIEAASWVSMLYFKLNWSQQKISEELSISRSYVSTLLSLARESGIVTIDLDIDKHRKIVYQQEFELKEKYSSLKKAYIFQSESSEYTSQNLDKFAALVLEKELQDSEIIGINLGEKVKKAILNLRSSAFKSRNRKYIVQVMGASKDMQPNELVKLAARKLSAEPVFLNCPFIVENTALKKTLLKEPLVANALGFWNRIDTGIMGIGELSGDKIKKYNLPKEIKNNLFNENPVGELSGNFFDSNGVIITAVEEYLISISASDLMNINKKIIISSGKNKIRPMKAAMSCGLIDILITDSLTVRNLLQ